MRSITPRSDKSSLLLFLTFLVLSTLSINAQTYSGGAAAVRSTVSVPLAPVLTNAVNDTGPLPSAGGSVSLQSATAAVPNVVSVGASTVTTSGGVPGGNVNTSQSTASVSTINIAVGGVLPALTVTADAVTADTSCICPLAVCSGNSSVTNLRIGGNLVTVTGTINQTVVVSAGTVTLTLVINERLASPGSITANALHATFVDSLTGTTTSVVVASAHSEITCLQAQTSNRYSGRGTGIRLRANTLIPPTSVSTIVSDTGSLPRSGGNLFVTTAGASLPGIFTTGVITSASSGGLPGGNEDSSQSNSSVTNFNATLVGGVDISATILQSNTACQCTLLVESCSGDSEVLGLSVTVLGINVPITIDGTPNQGVVLPFGLGSLIINEQVSAGPGDLTINALHVFVTPVGLASTDLVLAQSHSDIQCRSAATAAPANISGRVLDARGRGLANVTVTAQDGEFTRRAMTNGFGYYTIFEVPTGASYVLSAKSRSYTFDPIVVSLNDDLTDVNFAPLITRSK